MPSRPSSARPADRPARRGAPPRATPVDRLRALCLALPEAAEKISHGEPTWFAGRGKVFAMLDDHHHGAEHLAVWLPAAVGVQEALVEDDPGRFFRPPYVGPRGWVGVVLDRGTDWAELEGLLVEAYRMVAARRLVAALDARPDSKLVEAPSSAPRRGATRNP